MFENLKSDGLEETTDRVGGYSPFESDIYSGVIKVAYGTESQNGALGVVLIIDIGGKELRETEWVSNRNKENYWINEQKKKVPLPGFLVIDDMCLIVTGKPLDSQTMEEKIVKVYDADSKAEVPKSVPVLTELTGQPIAISILKNLENKNAKDNSGTYVPTSETRITNTIGTVFHPDERRTVREATKGVETAQFWDAWLKANKGREFDRRKIKDGSGGQPGAPRANSRAPTIPPQAGASQGQRKSLFGNKS